MAPKIKARETNVPFHINLPRSVVTALTHLRHISDEVGADFVDSLTQALSRFAREYRDGLKAFTLPDGAKPSQARDVKHRELLRTNGLDSLKPPAIDNGTDEKV